MSKIALITGITGQDGSYLAEFLLNKGYEVHGLVRRHSISNTERVDHIINSEYNRVKFFLHYADVTDSSNLMRLIAEIRPTEVYNLAAQSHVGISFEVPEYTAEATGVSTLKLLEALRVNGGNCRYYQASTSELFGGLENTAPQSEATPFYPKSPYGAAKLYAYWITVNYRESYNMFACNGILFNHESPRRGENFVTRKITMALANIIAGKQNKLSLGNMDAKRDWGFAGDYVEGMWRILQHDVPGDFVLATNETHTVRQFVEASCEELGIEIRWEGAGVEEKGYDAMTGRLLVDVNPEFYRPAEVEYLWGDPSKAEKELNWKRKVDFKGLVSMMMDADLKAVAGMSCKEYRDRKLD
ncbi:GDP-mannose 4,6-dehydratase [Enterocloster bolteae]|uniref:GDP-mannose 4,6-dehydratase n=1 Tax=Enterocloster bolteae TaxID=208479 RepID=UPI000E435C94|nr:GDP-mannose 4,6-dehydratase [Enterocloster bolteae]MCB6928864.1 GDP-mannose 4,6-dehydratase [Enterocloster bolteae]MCQ4758430.1 GDP-mannose 4,6-dehydratase [Enterocloster bolteae]MDU3288146.1 GDP-mannose 4,6-dehydratase [Enterocloster bolteae]RGK68155.1 GDP-mannose 4,6-dehydratase [Enterocloster bolteae]